MVVEAPRRRVGAIVAAFAIVTIYFFTVSLHPSGISRFDVSPFLTSQYINVLQNPEGGNSHHPASDQIVVTNPFDEAFLISGTRSSITASLLFGMCSTTTTKPINATSQSKNLTSSSSKHRSRSYGTNIRFPPITFEEMPNDGKTQYATRCAGALRPLHVAVVLPAFSPNIDDDLSPMRIPPLRSQINLLTRDAPKTLVSNLLVTVILELLPPPNQAIPSKMAYVLLHFTSNSAPASVVVSGVTTMKEASDDHWQTIQKAMDKAVKNLRVSETKEALQQQIIRRKGIQKRPHFVLPLPSNTYVTTPNLRGICHLDTVINDESEATAVYPFAEPFVPVGRKTERNGRMTVGLIRAVGDQVTVVSSCRPPVELTQQQRMIEGGHYSKGGDMAIRGSLWSLDLGSAIERAGTPSAIIPKRSVIVPFMAGVHSELILTTPSNSGGLVPPLNNGQRMAIFPLRRPIIDSHCSSDPKNPVRVSTHMVLFVHEKLDKMRNGFDVFVRVLNATALMTGFVDLTITTNLPADLLLKYLRADVRELPPTTFVTNPELDDSDKGTRFLDKSYPNPLGEMVIVTAHRQNGGSWYGLAGKSHFPLLSQLGFFDIVQYTEDDVYLSRDQFAHYCATLPFLEAREEFLNQIRWETVWDEIDEGPPKQTITMHDGYMWRRPQISVLQSKIPKFVAIPDKRPQIGWSWRTDPGSEYYAINVTLKDSRQGNDRYRNTVAYPVPLAPVDYEVAAIPVEACRFVGAVSTHLKNNTEAHVSGCYTLAHAHHVSWQRNRIYNSMWTLPTHRVQNFYLEGLQNEETYNEKIKGPKWRGFENRFDQSDVRFPFNRDCVYMFFRESILYFQYTPLNSYRMGGVFMVYMEEGEDLGAFKNREAGGPEADKPQGRYGLHRFGGINHGRNQYPNMDDADRDVVLIQPSFSIAGLRSEIEDEPLPKQFWYMKDGRNRTGYRYE